MDKDGSDLQEKRKMVGTTFLRFDIFYSFILASEFFYLFVFRHNKMIINGNLLR